MRENTEFTAEDTSTHQKRLTKEKKEPISTGPKTLKTQGNKQTDILPKVTIAQQRNTQDMERDEISKKDFFKLLK